MTLPAVLLGFVISSLYGVLFHIVRDGRIARLLLYLALSWTGFALGHLIGAWRGWVLFPVGSLNVGLGTLGSLILLGMSEWIGFIKGRPQSGV